MLLILFCVRCFFTRSLAWFLEFLCERESAFLLSPELGFELLQLLNRELQDGSIGGYSRIQKSYVDTDDGLGIGTLRFHIAFGVDLSYEMPLSGIMGHCVAHYLALETDLFRYADTSDVGQLDSIAVPCDLRIINVKRLLAALLVELRLRR